VYTQTHKRTYTSVEDLQYPQTIIPHPSPSPSPLTLAPPYYRCCGMRMLSQWSSSQEKAALHCPS